MAAFAKTNPSATNAQIAKELEVSNSEREPDDLEEQSGAA